MAAIQSVLDTPYSQIPFPKVVDNSMISTFKACEGKGLYSYLENLAPRGTSVHLHAGGAFAYGMEHTRRAFYVEGKSADEAIALGVSKLLAYYGDYECPPESPKSAERMAGALVYYFDTYKLGSDHIVPWTDGESNGIEFSFAIPLPIPHPESGEQILYAGRFDMLGRDERSGSLFVVDEKTASSLGQQWTRQWELDSQFTGYCAAAQLYGKPVAGAIIRGVSILKTKYDTAEAIIYRPQWMIDRWYDETIRRVKRMIQIWKGGADEAMWQFDKHSCGAYGGCAFSLLCSTPNPSQWKAVNFEPRTWHPMLREEREAEIEATATQG